MTTLVVVPGAQTTNVVIDDGLQPLVIGEVQSLLLANSEGPKGKQGDLGPTGPQGPSAAENDTFDPGDLTLWFDNGLI